MFAITLSSADSRAKAFYSILPDPVTCPILVFTSFVLIMDHLIRYTNSSAYQSHSDEPQICHRGCCLELLQHFLHFRALVDADRHTMSPQLDRIHTTSPPPCCLFDLESTINSSPRPRFQPSLLFPNRPYLKEDPYKKREKREDKNEKKRQDEEKREHKI